MKAKYQILLLLFLFPAPSGLWAQVCALNVASGSVTLSNTSVTYCSVVVSAGATLVIQAAVTINVTGNVDIEGTVYGISNGYGSAYTTSLGPGGGSNSPGGGGGGGGHGGAGGAGGSGSAGAGGSGGPANDNPADPVLMGSGGGGVSFFGPPVSGVSFPSTGGAAFILAAPSGTVTLNGTIDMSGESVFPSLPPFGVFGDGGGAGGTISINAQTILFNGALNAIGGSSGNGGGGGGGGIILLCPTINPISGTGTYSVAGGAGGGANANVAAGSPGSPGVYTACSPSASNPGSDVLFLSKNLLQPFQEPVSIFWSTNQYPAHLKLRIYNTAGEWVQTLDDKQVSARYQNSISWTGTNWKGDRLASGVYFFLLTDAAGSKRARLLLVR